MPETQEQGGSDAIAYSGKIYDLPDCDSVPADSEVFTALALAQPAPILSLPVICKSTCACPPALDVRSAPSLSVPGTRTMRARVREQASRNVLLLPPRTLSLLALPHLTINLTRTSMLPLPAFEPDIAHPHFAAHVECTSTWGCVLSAQEQGMKTRSAARRCGRGSGTGIKSTGTGCASEEGGWSARGSGRRRKSGSGRVGRHVADGAYGECCEECGERRTSCPVGTGQGYGEAKRGAAAASGVWQVRHGCDDDKD
ncbi:hypothetical protein B0H19DRAFT_1272226 [Mycena capillaripes]|nr:hypothetical protein B0H19DRAFT_1272226 [Mycena capillaripes]